ncbi:MULTISPECIES: glutamine--fructose-6-phosphate transaminase (isomerizing) [unclassified Bradyrhizobium]|uniref:glutamine--fructose-6-phosphate transaminase (isomerizing) n=1 Tax=unclassified Bradyrhizobium TaxID=2631580 RepID=UPI00247A049D|nr:MULTISPECIES: glutamine--fructose-6-phosphate transaminase (isomerizing) [unclassified Bradyrhizobium]WGR68735.1 glutamine--fructose-6-phosphate transaminase (isomerizing) [Bradyrhizobium sp. ISRA426]WGR80790.1 glutamine--fructose-6-phosphate transaminase (isomerizing) [Bradyrhizobium sp. ISRA430]WGR83975.1 glutamine--fructose-6-phosphate transaminase (isomerizing) [Bradyrhizobium sp. ISRA432]
MCGIVGFVGQGPATAPILDALKRLEYRGYDSAGIATLEGGLLTRRRAVGKLVNLESRLASEPLIGRIGIGHTRWATHGRPNENNAHPHAADGVAVVHNGIIENHRELRHELKEAGAHFATETDSEVVVHLVSRELKNGCDPVGAVRKALPRLNGAFALAFLFEGHDNLLVGARKGSPLAVGYGHGEMFLGSDAIALAPLTDMISYLEDGDLAVITREGIEFLNVKGKHLQRTPARIVGSAVVVHKGEHRHFMAKEIHEQPKVLGQTLAQYIDASDGTIRLPEHSDLDFREINRVSITACGTAFYAGLIARYWFERYAKLPVEIDIASEFRYRDVPFGAGNLAIFVSQSGETADTLASLEFAKTHGQRVLSVVNVQTSTMARASQIVLPTLAGPEIGVASTKAFTCQLATLACIAIAAGRDRGVLAAEDEKLLVGALADIPRYVTRALELEPKIGQLARKISASRDALFIGRGTNYPLAMEGALKLKEITYIHAEGYAAGELKHGPIALIDKDLPVIVIAPGDMTFEKTMSNMQEVIARGGRIILLTDQRGASLAPPDAWSVLELPDVPQIVAPLVFAVPLQLLAYHTAVVRGTDVDQPRNLAKSVTVE